MGGAKRMLETQEDLRRMALSVLVQAGALKSCYAHELFYDGGGDVAIAYPLGNTLINREQLHLPEGTSRTEFSEAIHDAYLENSISDVCGHCDKHFSD